MAPMQVLCAAEKSSPVSDVHLLTVLGTAGESGWLLTVPVALLGDIPQ